MNRRDTSPGHSQRVLLVDDNVDTAEMLADYLRDCGHHVAVANEPKIALALAPAFAPQVALLDIGLPLMDGYELAARLRSLTGGSECRFIAVTGFGRNGDRVRSSAAGFECHLVKPVDVEALERLVRGNGPGTV
jgi:CheY-like chemotaxis protein